MIDPEGTGSPEDEGLEEDIALPSWIDAAIAKSQSRPMPVEGFYPPDAPLDAQEETPAYGADADTNAGADTDPGGFQPTHGNEWLAEHEQSMVDETAPEEPATAERAPLEIPLPQRDNEPFPSFLSRSNLAPAVQPDEEPDGLGLEEDLWTEFEDEDSPVFVQHERPGTIPMPEQIPIPEAPPRFRGIVGPWLIAAIFFAVAALVLAVLIWLKPLPR
jgi:hypothetical protein